MRLDKLKSRRSAGLYEAGGPMEKRSEDLWIIPYLLYTSQAQIPLRRLAPARLPLTRGNRSAIIAYAIIIMIVRRVREWDCIGTLYPPIRRRRMMVEFQRKTWRKFNQR